MCGIFGEINSDTSNLTLFRNSLDKMDHGGPDNTKIFKKDGVIFGSKRLSIRDLNDNATPPLLNETKDIVIIQNGEIYNTKQLGIVLKKKNIALKTKSDTEIILRLYCYFGIEATLSMLEGMVAFAIYDFKIDTANEVWKVQWKNLISYY